MLVERGAHDPFLTDLEVFDYLMKHSFERLIKLAKPLKIQGELKVRSEQV